MLQKIIDLRQRHALERGARLLLGGEKFVVSRAALGNALDVGRELVVISRL